MQKLAYILLLLCPLTLSGQGFGLLGNTPGEIPVFDLRSTAENTFDVLRFPDSHLGFSTAAPTGNASGEILAAAIKTDSLRSIELTLSIDGGRTWHPTAPLDRSWDAAPYRSLSLFNPNGEQRKRPRRQADLLLFSGGFPLVFSSSYDNGQRWSPFHPVNRFGGFRISGLIRLRDGRLLALFHDDGRLLYNDGATVPELRKSAIYKIYSSDGGVSWSEPQIALKHNLYGLGDAAIIDVPGRSDDRLVLICSDRESRTAYIAYSDDGGATWSYPEPLPPFLRGDRFGIAHYGKELLIAYRDMRPVLADGHSNPTYGDLVLWGGTLNDLIHGRRQGFKIRVADNYPTDEATDPGDMHFSDCGYASVIPLAGRQIAIIAYGRWEKDAPPFVRSYILHLYDIHEAMQQLAKRR